MIWKWVLIRQKWAIFFILALTALLLTQPIHWQNDLATLSPVPKQLIVQDRDLRSLFQQPESTQMLVFEANSIESLLQQQERLYIELEGLRQQGVIAAYLGLASLLPSQQKQHQRQSRLLTVDQIDQAINQANTPLEPKLFSSFKRDYDAARHMPLLSFESFISAALPWQQPLIHSLVTHHSDGKVQGKIWLQQTSDPQALQQLAEKIPGLVYFHQRTLVAKAVDQIRKQILNVLIGVFLLVLVFLLFRVGRSAFLVTALVAISSLLALFVLALFSSLTIFHLVALILVIAIGIDYVLFAQAADADPRLLDSVNTALMTTLISFGLLQITSIPILDAIGQTVVVGVLISYLLSRLVYRV